MTEFLEKKSGPKNFNNFFFLEIDFLEGLKYSLAYPLRVPTFGLSYEALALKMYFWRIFEKILKSH